MLRRTLLIGLLALIIGGSYVWFSLSPGEDVNMDVAMAADQVADKVAAAVQSKLPVALSSSEVKTLAVEAIKQVGIGDKIKGIDVTVKQDALAVSLAIDAGPKVVAVSVEAAPEVQDDKLVMNLSAMKVGAVPVNVPTLIERTGVSLPSGVEIEGNAVTVDLSKLNGNSLPFGEIKLDNGTVVLKPGN